MYSFKNKWNNNEFVGFCEYFSRLYDRAINTYHFNNPVVNEKELNTIERSFDYIEYFFKYLIDNHYFIDNLDFIRGVVNLRGVYVLPLEYRKSCNGLTLEQVVYFNPDIVPFDGLSEEDSFILSVFHEMSHIFSDSNDFFFNSFKRDSYNEYRLKEKYGNIVSDFSFLDYSNGFDMLDEAVAQEIAEDALCSTKGYDRRCEVLGENKKIYPNGSFKYNFHQYQEFQDMANKFIYFLGLCTDVKDGLHVFSRRYFDRNFLIDFYMDTLTDYEKIDDFAMMLICMGKVKEAVYSGEEMDVSKYIKLFNDIYQKNVQYDEGGYQKVKE